MVPTFLSELGGDGESRQLDVLLEAPGHHAGPTVASITHGELAPGRLGASTSNVLFTGELRQVDPRVVPSLVGLRLSEGSCDLVIPWQQAPPTL